MKNAHQFSLKVYTEDTDYGGVVYHARYLHFFDRARTEWMDSLGVDITWQKEKNVFFPVRSASLDYLRPARLGDALQVTTRIVELKRASVVFAQQLYLLEAPATILCKAEIKVACVNAQFRPTSIPDCKLYDLMIGEPE